MQHAELQLLPTARRPSHSPTIMTFATVTRRSDGEHAPPWPTLTAQRTHTTAPIGHRARHPRPQFPRRERAHVICSTLLTADPASGPTTCFAQSSQSRRPRARSLACPSLSITCRLATASWSQPSLAPRPWHRTSGPGIAFSRATAFRCRLASFPRRRPTWPISP